MRWSRRWRWKEDGESCPVTERMCSPMRNWRFVERPGEDKTHSGRWDQGTTFYNLLRERRQRLQRTGRSFDVISTIITRLVDQDLQTQGSLSHPPSSRQS